MANSSQLLEAGILAKHQDVHRITWMPFHLI